MHCLKSVFFAGIVVFGSTFAATADTQSPLPPGKPAGVKAAALHAPLWVWIAGVGFVALGVGLVASGNGNGSTTTTTGTAPR